jgi:hypothetical protein
LFLLSAGGAQNKKSIPQKTLLVSEAPKLKGFQRPPAKREKIVIQPALPEHSPARYNSRKPGKPGGAACIRGIWDISSGRARPFSKQPPFWRGFSTLTGDAAALPYQRLLSIKLFQTR